MWVLSLIGHGIGSGLLQTLSLFWESLYGLVLGFLISAIVQTLVPESVVRRFASDSVRGVVAMAGFGIISSSCSYASAAVTRSLYRRGAGIRSAFAFLVSSTNMNVAILIMFWVLVGWKFAFAEFLGGIVIISVVATGLSVLFRGEQLERLRAEAPQQVLGEVVDEDVICGMEGSREHAVAFDGRTYLFCNAQHARQFRQKPEEYAYRLAGPDPRGEPKAVAGATAGRIETRDPVCGMEGSEDIAITQGGLEYRFCSEGCRDTFAADPGRHLREQPGREARPDLSSLRTWYEITQKFVGDVKMLRTELIVGFFIAGFAEALIPHQWFSSALQQIGQVPVIGYVLLLLLGLAIAVATFVCSMGNVPVAQFLKVAGVPLGANTAYIYGDLLILPLVRIYRKSFAPRLVAAFLGLFVLGACIAGALMELLIGHLSGGL